MPLASEMNYEHHNQIAAPGGPVSPRMVSKPACDRFGRLTPDHQALGTRRRAPRHEGRNSAKVDSRPRSCRGDFHRGEWRRAGCQVAKGRLVNDLPPPKVIAGEPIICLEEHQVGTVLNTVPLALSILAKDISITDGETVSLPPRYRVECRQCGNPIARIDDRDRWSVRLKRGWVR